LAEYVAPFRRTTFLGSISNSFFSQKVELAGFGELRIEPGQLIETSNQNGEVGDCFPKVLKDKSRN
jgi:hypothetical protein